MARSGNKAIAAGKADTIFTKKLRERFSPTGKRNFGTYARSASRTLNSKTIMRQVQRLERAADQAIRRLKST
jgi:hypothetical protein